MINFINNYKNQPNFGTLTIILSSLRIVNILLIN